jgi:hypothetical protein
MKRLKRKLLAICIAISLAYILALPGHVGAAPLVADFDGTVYWVNDPATGVVLNDVVHGRLRYDSDAPPEPDSDQQALYRNVTELSLTFVHEGAPVQSFAATGGTIVINSTPNLYAFYARGSAGLDDDTLLGQPLEALTLNLQNDQGVPGSTTALPVELALAQFNPLLSFVDVDVNDVTWLSAYVTSIHVVPEPGGMAMMVSGVIAIGAWRFHRTGRSRLATATGRAA